MTESEAEKIQNSINVLQEMLDAHYAEIRRIRPQEKGMNSSIRDCKIKWSVENGILDHIEIENCGTVDIRLNVYKLYTNNRNPRVPLSVCGTCIGVIYVGAGNTEWTGIGYPCDYNQPIMLEVIDARENEIIKVIEVI